MEFLMYTIAKINKRMHILDSSGNSVYSPPDYVRMLNRTDLQKVADQFNTHGYNIKFIIEFQSDIRFRADYRKNKEFYYEEKE